MIFNGFTKQDVGLKKAVGLGETALWNPGSDLAKLPDRIGQIPLFQSEGGWIEDGPGVLNYLDIEHWTDPGLHAETMRLFHSVYPERRTGFYGELPKREYQRFANGYNSEPFKRWQVENDAKASIAREADFLMPSLYAFYKDPAVWVEFAEANIAEARRFGIPVYVFIWPQYHNGSQFPGEYIAGDFWRIQMETCLRHADATIIWGVELDMTQEWWSVTQEFIPTAGK